MKHPVFLYSSSLYQGLPGGTAHTPLNTHKAAAFEHLSAVTPTAVLSCGPGSWCGWPLAFVLGRTVSSFHCAVLSATDTRGLDLGAQTISFLGGTFCGLSQCCPDFMFHYDESQSSQAEHYYFPHGLTECPQQQVKSISKLTMSFTHLQLTILWLFGQKLSVLDRSECWMYLPRTMIQTMQLPAWHVLSDKRKLPQAAPGEI